MQRPNLAHDTCLVDRAADLLIQADELRILRHRVDAVAPARQQIREPLLDARTACLESPRLLQNLEYAPILPHRIVRGIDRVGRVACRHQGTNGSPGVGHRSGAV